MSIVRFCADLHFGHENMLKHRSQVSSIEEHDARIVECWNKVVSNRDVTYILGDITMENKRHYHMLDELNGLKHVVLGNHDKRQHVEELLKHVQSVSAMVKYKKKVFLTHCPIHPMELGYRVDYNIHGHIHEKYVMRKKFGIFNVRDTRYKCVSLEHIDFTPVTLKELGI